MVNFENNLEAVACRITSLHKYLRISADWKQSYSMYILHIIYICDIYIAPNRCHINKTLEDHICRSHLGFIPRFVDAIFLTKIRRKQVTQQDPASPLWQNISIRIVFTTLAKTGARFALVFPTVILVLTTWRARKTQYDFGGEFHRVPTAEAIPPGSRGNTFKWTSNGFLHHKHLWVCQAVPQTMNSPQWPGNSAN